MNILNIIILYILIPALFLNIYYLIRVDAVYRLHMWFLYNRNDLEKYLPYQNLMIFKFWMPLRKSYWIKKLEKLAERDNNPEEWIRKQELMYKKKKLKKILKCKVEEK